MRYGRSISVVGIILSLTSKLSENSDRKMNGMETYAKYFGIEQYKYKPFFCQRAAANVHQEKPDERRRISPFERRRISPSERRRISPSERRRISPSENSTPREVSVRIFSPARKGFLVG